MPDLVGIDPVPVRALAYLQQGSRSPFRAASSRPGARKVWTIMAALGMRLQPEAGDDLVRGHASSQAGGGTVASVGGSLEKVVSHLASLGRLARQL